MLTIVIDRAGYQVLTLGMKMQARYARQMVNIIIERRKDLISLGESLYPARWGQCNKIIILTENVAMKMVNTHLCCISQGSLPGMKLQNVIANNKTAWFICKVIMILPVKNMILPVKDMIIPVKDMIIPVKNMIIPVKNMILPVKNI